MVIHDKTLTTVGSRYIRAHLCALPRQGCTETNIEGNGAGFSGMRSVDEHLGVRALILQSKGNGVGRCALAITTGMRARIGLWGHHSFGRYCARRSALTRPSAEHRKFLTAPRLSTHCLSSMPQPMLPCTCRPRPECPWTTNSDA